MHFPKVPLLKALHSLSGRVLLILIMVVINVFALIVIFFLIHRGQRCDAAVQQAFRRKDYMSGCPDDNGYFGSNRACNEFFVCLNGTAYRMLCRSDLQWNGQNKNCVPSDESDCGKRFECPEPMGLFRNPDDCFSYYSCAYGIPYLMDCPTPLQWSSQTQRCEWAENSDCGRGIPVPTRSPRPLPTLSTSMPTDSSTAFPTPTTPKFTSSPTTISTTTASIASTSEDNAGDHQASELVTSSTPFSTTVEMTTSGFTTIELMTTTTETNPIIGTTDDGGDGEQVLATTTEKSSIISTSTLSPTTTSESTIATTENTTEVVSTTEHTKKMPTTTTVLPTTDPPSNQTTTTTLFSTLKPEINSTVEMQTTTPRLETTTLESLGNQTTLDPAINTIDPTLNTTTESTTDPTLPDRTTTEASFVCPDVNGYFADPASCEHYYLCLRGKPIHKQCPLGKQFNSKQLSCNQKILSDCGQNSI